MTIGAFDEIIFPKLAEHYGTPLYVYSARHIKEQYVALSRCLEGVPSTICYAVKANSNISVLRFIGGLGAGFDIVSAGELARVLRTGSDPGRVVFSGVGKKADEIAFALKSGIRWLNVESSAELDAISATAKELSLCAPVALRLNPDVDPKTHPYLSTGMKKNKFGIAVPDALKLYDRISRDPSIRLVALDCHIGSQITEIQPLHDAYTAMVEAKEEFESRGAKIAALDLGGGLGVGFSGHYTPLPLREFGDLVRKIYERAQCELVFEPGKFLVAEAGVLLTRVVYLKSGESKAFAVVDAGMNDLIRPSLYQAFHQINLVGKPSRSGTAVVDVVGPVCETGCFLGRDRELPVLSQGDLLVVRDAGAYGFAMASSYNTRGLPAEVLLDTTGNPHLIRQRDSVADLMRKELLVEIE